MSHITFYGAAGTVTGSRHLISIREKKDHDILLDCGLFQGRKKLRRMNWQEEGLLEEKIDAVFLSHAHIDHSGFLPRLVKFGYDGPIVCTGVTREISEILLRDSAHLHEEDAKYAQKMNYSKHDPPLPLYDGEDAQQTNQLFKEWRYNKPYTRLEGVDVRFLDAGHILGSSFIELTIQREKGPFRLLYTGDFGKYEKLDLMPDPTPVDHADLLVLESTYGNREHPREDPSEAISECIKRIQRNQSTLIIPAFAVERAQEILFILRKLEQAGKLPRHVPVYLDSPLSVKATEIFNRHKRNLSDYFKRFNTLFPKNTHFVRSVKESKKLNGMPGPLILISASGMLEGGRILHHLKYRLSNPLNVILFVGFQASGTRGDRMLNGEETVKIHGRHYPVKLRIEQIMSMSSHGDYNDMMRWLRNFKRLPERICLVHGEEDALNRLKQHLVDTFNYKDEQIFIPEIGDTLDF